MSAIRGGGMAVMRDVMDKLKDPLRKMPEQYLKAYTEKVRVRCIVKARGTSLQPVGFPPTPMYETYLLYNTMTYNWIGFRAPEYAEDLERSHGEIWSPTVNECNMLGEMLAANIEKRQIDYAYGSGI